MDWMLDDTIELLLTSCNYGMVDMGFKSSVLTGYTLKYLEINYPDTCNLCVSNWEKKGKNPIMETLLTPESSLQYTCVLMEWAHISVSNLINLENFKLKNIGKK